VRDVEEHDLLNRIADEDPQARVVGWQSASGSVVRRGDGRPQVLESDEESQPPPLAPSPDDHEDPRRRLKEGERHDRQVWRLAPSLRMRPEVTAPGRIEHADECAESQSSGSDYDDV